MTPYQYTYLNLFNGKSENRYKKFENDYWASSLEELIKRSRFDEGKITKFATCGVPAETSKIYFEEKGYYDFTFVHPEEADYIIMTNRVSRYHGVMNCFDLFKGNDIAVVKRNGLILSVIRKIKT